MCGIAGRFDYRPGAARESPSAEMARVSAAMRARGPDGAGEFAAPAERIALVHRRLAIIDPGEQAAQPMNSSDMRYVIVFNGEIYNYAALGEELRGRGAVLRTNSDTEVIIELFRRDGPAMLSSLRGMFAFAIWDRQARTLFMARDPFGIKPLYFADDGCTLRFASQASALASAGMRTVADPAGKVGFLLSGHVPEPFTLWREIEAMPAGTWRRYRADDGCVENVVYADLAAVFGQPGASGRAGAGEALQATVAETVRRHVVADVPIVLFLSAGIDSAVLAAHLAQQAVPVHAITLGFAEFAGTPADETATATALAAHLGIAHSVVRISRREFLDSVDGILAGMDLPSIDGVNTWLISRAAARMGYKVALSGVGGDEFFMGYPSFRSIPRFVGLLSGVPLRAPFGRLMRRLLSPLVGKRVNPKLLGLLESAGSFDEAFSLLRALHLPWELDALVDADDLRLGIERIRASQEASVLPQSSQTALIQLEVQRYLRPQLLRDADWAGMANSVEIRTPLVDWSLFCRLAPWLGRGSAALTKSDLAASVTPALPEAIVNRRKTGFEVPLYRWLGGDGAQVSDCRRLRPWAARVLAAMAARARLIELATESAR